jgi:hypothetical protein
MTRTKNNSSKTPTGKKAGSNPTGKPAAAAKTKPVKKALAKKKHREHAKENLA